MKHTAIPNTHHAKKPSNGEVARFVFQKRLDAHRKAFSDSSLQFVLKSLDARERVSGANFSKDTNQFLKANIPLCFSHLEARVSRITDISGKLASASEDIFACSYGRKVFSWAMERAIAIAETDSSPQFARTISLLFEACAKVCKMEKPVEVNSFFFALDGVPPQSVRKFLAALSRADSHSELHNAITVAYSEAQQIRLSGSKGIFSGVKY